ncbi:hypothetical protein BSZ25_20705 [Bradyrhizobium canariense]|nr:hypothetical protein BSZ23_14700 [Bradyrhizobium canariense]OSI89668.1 hypothetical protein BSZ25_20705 [Bradyrhizobium canariense]OSI90954.1 hypothetical protein BSZ24_18500 [Bradyrhizobium canariense]OSJ04033.1 hypothetical protein BSZ16_15135 [Bradyrhizobium canariense]
MLGGALVLCGFGGVLWSSAAMPMFWVTAPAQEMSARIMADDRFKPGALARVLAKMDQFSPPLMLAPEFVRAKTLVELRVAEEDMLQKKATDADRSVETAESEAKAALSVSPSDPFLWLMLYSIDTARNGFNSKSIGYLDASYAFGAREGWIALRRNRMALGALQLLSISTQKAIVSEFASVVDAGFIEEAAANLTTAGWLHRDALIEGLASIGVREREALVRRLSRDGIRVTIAGFEMEERPWR